MLRRACLLSILQVFLLVIHIRYSIGFLADWGLFHHSVAHFPLPGFDFLARPEVLLALSVGIAAASLWALWDKSGWGLLASSVLGVAFMLTTTESRYAFTYFPSLALFAVAIGTVSRTFVPAVLFMSSVYLAAATHKLVNFSQMSQGLPGSFSVFLTKDFEMISSQLPGFLLQGMVWTVIPVELLIGWLILFKKTRPWGFVVAAIFHFSIQLLTGGSRYFLPVGFNLLLVHAMIATHESEFSWKDLRKVVSLKWFGAVFLLAGIGDFFTTSDTLAHGILQGIWCLGPLILIGAIGYLPVNRKKPVDVFKYGLQPNFRVGLTWAACFVFLLWAVSPALLQYSNEQVGWAMFSGSSIGRPEYSVTVRKSDCLQALQGNVFLSTKAADNADEIIYVSKQEHVVDVLKKYLTEHCPESYPVSSLPTAQ